MPVVLSQMDLDEFAPRAGAPGPLDRHADILAELDRAYPPAAAAVSSPVQGAVDRHADVLARIDREFPIQPGDFYPTADQIVPGRAADAPPAAVEPTGGPMSVPIPGGRGEAVIPVPGAVPDARIQSLPSEQATATDFRPTLAERGSQIVGATLRGAAGMAGAAISGLGSAADYLNRNAAAASGEYLPEEIPPQSGQPAKPVQLLRSAGQALESAAESNLPKVEGSGFLSEALPHAAGGLLAFMAAHSLGGTALASGGGALVQAEQMRKEAEAAGADQAQQDFAFLSGLPIGVLNDILPNGAAGRILSAGKVGGAQALQQLLANVGARLNYDPQRDLSAGVGQAGLMGGILGGGIATLQAGLPEIPKTRQERNRIFMAGEEARSRAEAVQAFLDRARAAMDEFTREPESAPVEDVPPPQRRGIVPVEQGTRRPLWMDRRVAPEASVAEPDAPSAAVADVAPETPEPSAPIPESSVDSDKSPASASTAVPPERRKLFNEARKKAQKQSEDALDHTLSLPGDEDFAPVPEPVAQIPDPAILARPELEFLANRLGLSVDGPDDVLRARINARRIELAAPKPAPQAEPKPIVGGKKTPPPAVQPPQPKRPLLFSSPPRPKPVDVQPEPSVPENQPEPTPPEESAPRPLFKKKSVQDAPKVAPTLQRAIREFIRRKNGLYLYEGDRNGPLKDFWDSLPKDIQREIYIGAGGKNSQGDFVTNHQARASDMESLGEFLHGQGFDIERLGDTTRNEPPSENEVREWLRTVPPRTQNAIHATASMERQADLDARSAAHAEKMTGGRISLSPEDYKYASDKIHGVEWRGDTMPYGDFVEMKREVMAYDGDETPPPAHEVDVSRLTEGSTFRLFGTKFKVHDDPDEGAFYAVEAKPRGGVNRARLKLPNDGTLMMDGPPFVAKPADAGADLDFLSDEPPSPQVRLERIARKRGRASASDVIMKGADSLEQMGRDILKRRGRTLNTLDPEIIGAYTMIGAAKIARGATRFAMWSKQMIEEFGDKIEPHLQAIWAGAKHHFYDLNKDVPVKGRPDLANPGETPGARRFVDRIDQLRNEQGKPARISDKTVTDQALNLLESDYDGVRERLMNSVRKGGELGGVETVAMRMIIANEAAEAALSSDPRVVGEAALAATGWRELGANDAREFRQRRDALMNPLERMRAALGEAMITPDQATLDKIARLRRKGGDKNLTEAEKLAMSWGKKALKVKDDLAAIGVDLEALLSGQKDSASVEAAKAAAEARMKKGAQKLADDIGMVTPLEPKDMSNLVATVQEHLGFEKPAEKWTPKALKKLSATIQERLGLFDDTVRMEMTRMKKAVIDAQEELGLPRSTDQWTPKDFDAVMAIAQERLGLYDSKSFIPSEMKKLLVSEQGELDIHSIVDQWTPDEFRRYSPAEQLTVEETRRLLKTVQEITEKYGSTQDWVPPEPTGQNDLFDLRESDEMIRAIRELSAAKKDNWDALYEYWVSSILSNPQTHVVNTLSNIASIGWDATAQRLAEVAVNETAGRLFGRNKDAAQAGELRHYYSGMIPALGMAWRNAIRSFKTEVGVMEKDLDISRGDYRSETNGPAITGAKGRFVRIPLRLLTAADEFMVSFSARAEVGAIAYRSGVKKGLKGSKLAEHINAQVDDLSSVSWEKAIAKAKDLTFKGDNALTNVAVGFRKSLNSGLNATVGIRHGADYLFPFLRTPTNIMTMGLRKSPLGSLALLFRGARGLVATRAGRSEWSYSWDKAAPHVAEQLLAWGAMAALMGATAEDEKNGPRITGTIPYAASGRSEREFAQGIVPTQSIRIGGKWYSYSRIEPFATALAMTVDLINDTRSAESGGGADYAIKKLHAHLVGQVKDKTFFKGLSDLLEVLDRPAQVATIPAEIAAGFVPSFAKGIMRAADERVRERPDTFMRRMAYSALPVPALAPEKVDYLGREVPKARLGNQGTDFLFRLLSPVQVRDAKVDGMPGVRIDRAILNWNNEHPEDRWFPPLPERTFKVGKDSFTLTPTQYAEFMRRSGGIALRALEGGIGFGRINPDAPAKADVTAIRRALDRARDQVRAEYARDLKRGRP